MYLPKELHTIAECRSRKSCLLQISFRAVFPKGLCETVMQLPLPIQHTLQRGHNRPPLYASESPIANHRSTDIRPPSKITRHKVARLYFSCLLFFLLAFFFYSQSRRDPRSAIRSRHCTRIGRHNLDVYFSGQRGQGDQSAARRTGGRGGRGDIR